MFRNKIRISSVFAYEKRYAMSIAAGCVILLNALVAALITYPAHVGVASVEKEKTNLLGEIQKLNAYAIFLKTIDERFAENKKGIGEFYRKIIASKPERMTLFQQEIRRMARVSEMRFTGLNYRIEEMKDENLIRFSTTVPLEGTYNSVRIFLNEIENNNALFLTADSLALRNLAADRFDVIKVNIAISTYFLETSLPEGDDWLWAKDKTYDAGEKKL